MNLFSLVSLLMNDNPNNLTQKWKENHQEIYLVNIMLAGVLLEIEFMSLRTCGSLTTKMIF